MKTVLYQNLLKSLVLLLLLLNPPAVRAYDLEIYRDGLVTIHYTKGLQGAAEEVSKLLPDIRKEIARKLNMNTSFEFDIVLYKNRSDFLKLVKNSQISAFAVPDRNLIVIDYSQVKVHPLNLKLIVMHELCHIVLHRNINRYYLPKWLDEGVSQWISGGIYELVNYGSTDVLKKAYLSKRILRFNDIENSFPDEHPNLTLAYQQSRSLVEFIKKKHGIEGINNILLNLRDGNKIESAISKSLSIDMKELENKWYNSLRYKYTWISYLTDNIYWILFVFAALLTIYGFIRLRIKMMRYKDEDEDL